jgi:septum formation protein
MPVTPPTPQNPTIPIVLASQSSARAALLRAAGIGFAQSVAAVDEAAVKQAAQAEGTSAADTAVLLADLKARRLSGREADALVIGADQILVCDGRWFDKPADLAEARTHLLALRGRTHTLVTAAVVLRGGQRIWTHVATPLLTMRAFSDSFLDAYLAEGAARPTESVGAYRIEGPGVLLFDAVEGEHAAIMGLPMLALLRFLRQHGALLT